MKRLKVVALAMAGLSAMTLGGCGTLDSPPNGVGPGGGGPLAGAYPDTASSALANNAKLSSNSGGVNTAVRMQASDTAAPAVDDTSSVAIAKNSSGGYDVTVDGATTSFAATDETSEPGAQSGTYLGSYAKNASYYPADELTLFGTGTYSGVVAASAQTNGTDYSYAYAAVGSPTDPAALASKADATYSGRMIMTVAPDTPVNQSTTMNASVQGDVNLNADFTAGNVSGQVNNLSIEGCPGGGDCGAGSAGPGVPTDGSINMGTAPIAGNSFSGALTGTGAFAAAAGTYTGGFYGPTGQEAAGVMSGTAAGFAKSLTNNPGAPENDTFVGGFATTQK